MASPTVSNKSSPTVSMSLSECDQVLILSASDSEAWAKFLAARLSAPSYNINSKIIDVTTCIQRGERSDHGALPSSSEDDDANAIYTNDITIRNSIQEIEKVQKSGTENNNNVDTAITKDLSSSSSDVNNSQTDSLPKSTLQFMDSVKESIDKSRVCVLLISPEIVESDFAFCIDLKSLRERNTVLLCLGVKLEEVMQYFGPLYDHITNCRCSFIDGTEETICAGIVSIIEAFEDEGEEDTDAEYDTLPCQQIQKNTIEKVFPRMLTETERDVYILLSRIPEDTVQLIWLNKELTIPLTLVCERLYTFVLPANVYGEVTFQLECQGRRFGEESVHSYSKLDLVQNILTSEINPQTLIASSLGLDKDDTGGIDTALAFKLQELAPVMTFESLCPCEEALQNSSEEQSSKMWPTLLHFAADLNLRLLCSELLKYPGMVAAACTENSCGEYPCQIASRKGYSALENDLMLFMKRLRREIDPEYVTSKDANGRDRSDSDVSDSSSQPESSSTYCDMTETQRLRKPFLDVKQRSYSGHSPSRVPLRTLSDRCDGKNYYNRPLPKTPDSPDGSSRDSKDDETYSNPDESSQSQFAPPSQGSPTSVKALKRLGATEQEVASRYSCVDPQIAAIASQYSATCPPGTSLRTRLFNADDDDDDRMSVSSGYDGSSTAQDGSRPSSTDVRAGGLLKGKLRGFFKKVKGSKKSSADGDSSGKKLPGRARRGSEPSIAISSKNYLKTLNDKYSSSFDEERDSGSYSDEEKKKAKVFEEKNKKMVRRVSRRIEYARRDRYERDAPQLPETGRRSFKSYIDVSGLDNY